MGRAVEGDMLGLLSVFEVASPSCEEIVSIYPRARRLRMRCNFRVTVQLGYIVNEGFAAGR
jgi:hypothetical protein